MTPSAPSLLAQRALGDIAAEPFPHLVVKNPVPDDRYRRLVECLPEPDAILRGRDVRRSNSAARLPFFLAESNPAVDPAWQAFFSYHVSYDFWHDIVSVFGGVIRARYPTLEERVGRRLEDWRVVPRSEAVRIGSDVDVELDCQFVVNTPVRQVSAVRTAHVDGEDTLFSGLYYLRATDDATTGGDLQLGRWRRRPRFLPGRMIIPGDVDITKTIHYDANVFACFVNGSASVHAVTPREVTPLFRRYVNLIAKVGFNLFDAPPVGAVARYFNARALRRVTDRHLRGDRQTDDQLMGAKESAPRDKPARSGDAR